MCSCILIPAYKPDQRLQETIAALHTAGMDNIVVVDDGSGSEYRAVFDEAVVRYGVEILRHAVNMGKGRAIKTGFNYILETKPDAAAVVVDADGQHPAEAAVRAAQCAEVYPDALILGCRRFGQIEHMPRANRFGNWITRLFVRLLTGVRFSDTQCGLRGYPPDIMRALMHVAGERFEYETNTLLAVRKQRINVVEFDMDVVYEPPGRYVTTFHKKLDSLRIYKTLSRFASLPLLAWLIQSFGIVLLTAANYTRLTNTVIAVLCTAATQAAVALRVRQKASMLIGTVITTGLYGVLFYMLLSYAAPKWACVLLALPYLLLAAYPAYQRIGLGKKPKIIRYL